MGLFTKANNDTFCLRQIFGCSKIIINLNYYRYEQSLKFINTKTPMKNLLLLLVTIFTLNSCESDNNKPKTELEKLPPATQTGRNTAGCLVNGQAMIRKGFSSKFNCFYQDQLNFSLGYSMVINNVNKHINVTSLNQQFTEGQTYQLKEDSPGSKWGRYAIDASIIYTTTDIVTGELKITHHNYNKAIISGTFWFDAVNQYGEKVEVREGRFDAHY